VNGVAENSGQNKTAAKLLWPWPLPKTFAWNGNRHLWQQDVAN